MNSPPISFTRIAELFIQELRRGKSPRIEEYARLFPQQSEMIRQHFPALRMLESAYVPIELNPGDLLGTCVVEHEIGRGGMGVVYCAQDRVNNRKVALKVLPLHGMGRDGAERFSHEREAMSRLDHPNIVPVYSHGCTADFAYLVIKLIDGQNLAQIMRNEMGFQTTLMMSKLRTNWVAFAELASQLASGLQHAHDNNMVHRDIKPANLLLDREGKIWISDFGLAKLWDASHSVSLTGAMIGTPLYMAPEQSRGICDARSDIFSLGVTLYELASGQRAVHGETVGSLVRNQANSVRDIREISPAVPVELAKIIMRACQYDPNSRYQTAQEMQLVLDRYCQGFSKADRRGLKRPSNAVYRQRMRRNMRLTLAAGVCTCLLILTSPKIMSSLRYAFGTDGSQNYQAPAENIVDALALGNHEELVESIAHIFKSTIEKNSHIQSNYSETAKKELLREADKIKQMFLNKELTLDHMNKFINTYRGSSLAVTNRLSHLIPQVEQAFTDKAEREQAFRKLKQFGTALENGAVDKEAARQFIDDLFKGRINSLDEARKVRIPVSELRLWLNQLQTVLDALPPEQLRPHTNVPPKMEEVFMDSFGATEAAKQ